MKKSEKVYSFLTFLVLIIVLVGCFMCAGCQNISDKQYYNITPQNEKYATLGSDGVWRGPVKQENTKEGMRDHSLTEMPIALNFLNGLSF